MARNFFREIDFIRFHEFFVWTFEFSGPLCNNTIVVQSFLRISGEDQPLTLSEILDETHQLDADSKTKYWLENEALRNNPKISASMMRQGGETTYMYKPPFQIMNKKALLKLLKQYSIKGTYFILGFVIKALFFL